MKKMYPPSMKAIRGKMFRALRWSSLLAMLMINTLTTAQVRVVADLVPGRDVIIYPDEFGNLTYFNNEVYYVIQKYQLWKSNGTTEGTIMLREFDYIDQLKVIGDHILFVAGEEEHGQELWKTDGTDAGTTLLRDIWPGTQSSHPRELIAINETLYFVAHNGVAGKELWKSDGTTSGTQLVKDIQPGGGSSNPGKFTVMNNHLFFVANDAVTGYELWKSDGTASGTILVKDINPTYRTSSSPDKLVAANGTLFFTATLPETGRQLYKSDGTAAGTQLVKIIRPGKSNQIDHITAVNNQVFFQANDGIHGLELWKSDGTEVGTTLVKDITPGPGSASGYASPHLNHLKGIGDKLYFVAYTSNSNFWVSDGTESGTFQVSQPSDFHLTWINPSFTGYNGSVYFMAAADSLGLYKTDGTIEGTQRVKAVQEDVYYTNPQFTMGDGELYFFGYSAIWKTNGSTEGTLLIQDFTTPASALPFQLTDRNGTLFFTTGYFGGLWKTTGDEEGTSFVKSFRHLTNMRNVNGTVFFSGTESFSNSVGSELYKSDGTNAGTVLVLDIATSGGSSNPAEFTHTSNGIVFSALGNTTGRELWKTDGTAGGTQLIANIALGSASSNPQNFTSAGGNVFFTATNSFLGEELWRTNGTATGTALVKDIRPGSTGSTPENLASFQGKLYFVADDGVNGFELWRSNGSADGTIMLKDIRTADDGSRDISELVATNNALYFTALENDGSVSLWRSTGTTYGTTRVKKFSSTQLGTMIGTVGNEVIFVLRFENGSEIWKSNGTTSGTVMLKALPAEIHYRPKVKAYHKGVLYFPTMVTTNSTFKIWRSDGTTEGTYAYEVGDDVWSMTSSGPYVYFSGSAEPYGRELYVIDETHVTTMASSNEGDTQVINLAENEIDIVTGYPNPFSSSLTLLVRGREKDIFSLAVVNAQGNAVSKEENLNCNHPYQIGREWTSGLYIIQIKTGLTFKTYKVVKTN